MVKETIDKYKFSISVGLSITVILSVVYFTYTVTSANEKVLGRIKENEKNISELKKNQIDCNDLHYADKIQEMSYKSLESRVISCEKSTKDNEMRTVQLISDTKHIKDTVDEIKKIIQQLR
jgi:hypothetical protein